MAGSYIATTTEDDVQWLMAAGQSLGLAVAQLRHHLAHALTPAHGALLAEPVQDQAGRATDWYADGEGEALPLDSLPPGRRAAMTNRVWALLRDIRAEGVRLGGSADADERVLGAMLERVSHVPDVACVRVRGDAPVVIAWAHGRAGQSVDLATLYRPVDVPAEAGAAPATTRARWPGWLVPAGVGAALVIAAGVMVWQRDTEKPPPDSERVADATPQTPPVLPSIAPVPPPAQQSRTPGSDANASAGPLPPPPARPADPARPEPTPSTTASSAPSPQSTTASRPDPSPTPSPRPTTAAQSEPAPTATPAPSSEARNSPRSTPRPGAPADPAAADPTPTPPPSPPAAAPTGAPGPQRAGDPGPQGASDPGSRQASDPPVSPAQHADAPPQPTPPAASLPPHDTEATPARPLTAASMRAHDLSLLRGCWTVSGAPATADIRTQAAASIRSWRTCFVAPASGAAVANGTQSLVWEDGKSCAGPVTARFQADDRLQIADAADCLGDRTLVRMTEQCSRTDDATLTCAWTAHDRATDGDVRGEGLTLAPAR